MSRILITGANGFLGSFITKLMVMYHEVTIVEKCAGIYNRISDVVSKLNVYDFDTYDLEKIFAENKFDVIIHTATDYGRDINRNQDQITTNLLFPVDLVQIAIKHKVRTFINTDTFFNNNELNYKYLGSYTLTKKHLNEWLAFFSAKIQVVNMKLQHIYGPTDSQLKFVMHMINSMTDNVSELDITKGEQKRDFIYIEDVAQAFKKVVDNLNSFEEGFSTIEVGTGNSITIKEFLNLIHKLTNSKTKLNYGALPYREGEIMDSIANIQRLNNLGWYPEVKLKEGLQKIINQSNK
jgi:CDP-paratose synthetase